MLKVFWPRGSLYPGEVMVDSVYTPYDAAAKSSETGNSDHTIHALMIRVKNGE